MQAPTLFIIAADLTKMRVIADIDESDVGRIRPGQVAKFRVDAHPLEEFTGVVSQIRLQPKVVQNVVTYATVIDVPNPQLKLKPGMTPTVTIEVARRADVLRVPVAALRFRPTADMFTAFNQEMPQDFMQGGRRGQGGNAGGPGGAPGGTPAAGAPAGNGGGNPTPAAQAGGGSTGAPAAKLECSRGQCTGGCRAGTGSEWRRGWRTGSARWTGRGWRAGFGARAAR